MTPQQRALRFGPCSSAARIRAIHGPRPGRRYACARSLQLPDMTPPPVPPEGALSFSGCSSVGRAGGLEPSGRRFEPCHPDHRFCDPVAQLVERSIVNRMAAGSSPAGVAFVLAVAQLLRAPGCDSGDTGSSPVGHPNRVPLENGVHFPRGITKGGTHHAAMDR